MTDIEGYKAILKRLAESESEEFINNSSGDHAAAMIEEMFRKAEGKVRILTDHLNPAVYDRPEVKQSAKEFMNKSDSLLEVIMQFNEKDSVDLSENGFLRFLKEYKDKIITYKAEKDLKKVTNHFMVIKTAKGNYALRFETDIKFHIATGTFNAGKSGEKLYTYFDSCIEGSSGKVTKISNDIIWAN